MKKIISIVLLSLCCALPQSYAKIISRGTLAFSGDTLLNFTKTEYDNSAADDQKELEIELTGGYYFVDNLGVGLSVYFNRIDTGSYEQELFGIGPAFSIDIPIEEELNFNVKGFFGLVRGDVDDSYDVDGTSLQASVGLNYFPRDFFSLDFSLYFASNDFDYEYDSGYEFSADSDSFGTTIGITLYIQ